MGTLNFNVSALIRTHYFDSRFVSLWKVVQTTQYSRRLLSIAITNKNIIYLSVWTWRIAFSCTWFNFPSTRTTNSVRLSSARNILFARITSNEPVCFEGWNKSDPTENQIWHTAVASLASYQSTLISGRSFFSQWYFPSSEQSTEMKFYERSLQALLSSAPRGLAARSRIFVRLASLAQIGELARILCCLKRVKKKIKAICTVLISCTVWNFGYELKYYRWTSVKQVSRLPRGWCRDGGRGHDFQKIANLSALTGKKQNI